VDPEIWLCPGLVDLQVYGCCSCDLNAADLEIHTLQALARNLLATGVTTFVPTLITASIQELLRNLKVIADARRLDRLLLHRVPFVHIEGPHIDPSDGPRGARPVEQIRPPNISELLRWQELSSNLVGMVTLPPHYPEAPSYIRALSERGVYVSLAPANATDDQIRRAIDAGAQLPSCANLGYLFIAEVRVLREQVLTRGNEAKSEDPLDPLEAQHQTILA